jgi:glycosyltransferase involved in cell wall biosynthesis
MTLPDKARVITVLHYYATGPGQELHEWLAAQHAQESVLLEHPFPFSRRRAAVCTRRFSNGGTLCSHYPRRVRWAPLRYLLDVLRTLRIALCLPGTYDLYVGNGCLDTLPGLLLRRVGKVRRVVLYTIDYAPDAYGRIFGRIYRWLDRYCCYRSDALWNLTRERMTVARERDGLNLARSAPRVWVPHGTHARACITRMPSTPDQYRVAFFGHVKEGSGVQLLLSALPRLRSRFPRLTLDIIGDGEYLPTLQRMAVQHGVNDAVRFHGFIEEHTRAEELLMECGVGVALYGRGAGDYSFCGDPGKPKVYLACGLPVIISDVPEVAGLIAERRAGVAVPYDATALEAALATIQSEHAVFRANALALARDFEWSHVFARAWRETTEQLVSLRGTCARQENVV